MKIELRTNGIISPYILDEEPSASWRVTDAPARYRQAGYRITAFTEPDGDKASLLYDSGYVPAEDNTDIPMPMSLSSSQRVFWCVALTDAEGNEYVSDAARFETGLIRPEDKKAEWITAGECYLTNWSVLMRREFAAEKDIARAKAYVSGPGIYVMSINGKRAGDCVLDAAQTEYRQKILYNAYDIAPLLREGNNCVGVSLGDGWYHQSQLMEGRGIYGDPCLWLQIEIDYADGTRQYVLSGEGFRVSRGPVTMNNLYTGETYDARLEQDGWDRPGFDDAHWANAAIDTAPKGELRAQLMPPIRVTREIKPVSVREAQRGIFVFDMGENMAGYARLTVMGYPGNEITLRFAEVVDENGMLQPDTTGVLHIRGVQTLRYICAKEGMVDWEPSFTYFGFRYIEITGAHCDIDESCLTACKVHTDLAPLSAFECDMPILNQLEGMFRNTFTSNIHGLPTDCPHREKCGWTGDANIISDTAMLMYDALRFWDKYVGDIVDAHREYGQYNNVVPGRRGCLDTVPAWGTALITIPYRLYEAYGARSAVEKYYDEMAAYAAYILRNTTDYIMNDHEYRLGDWAAPYGYDAAEHFRQTNTAYIYLALTVMEKCALLLGKENDAARYRDTAARVKDAMNRAFYDYDAHTYGTQTLNAFCDGIGIAPEGERDKMADWCERDIEAHGCHITCGHIGIRYLFKFLTAAGRTDTIRRIFEKRDYPSFGEQIDGGATTLYECPGLDRGEHSLNHPFKGGYCLWLYEDVLGVRKTKPGYKEFTVKPLTTAIIREARGSIDTVNGTIRVDYRAGSYFRVTVPAGTRARVYVPGPDGAFTEYELTGGDYAF